MNKTVDRTASCLIFAVLFGILWGATGSSVVGFAAALCGIGTLIGFIALLTGRG